jgi:hypothetical protein
MIVNILSSLLIMIMRGFRGGRGTFVETTMSFLFQLKCLMARPMTFSDSPFA